MGLPLDSVSAPHTLTIAITRGDGLVARFGDVVMYIADPTASVDPLLTAVESVADMDHPRTVIAGRLAPIVFGEASHRVAPFGVVTATADDLHVILRGPITAQVEGVTGARTLSGGRALTWVDEILPESVFRVAVTTSGDSHVAGCPHTDLRAGVVPGGGFVLHRSVRYAAHPKYVAPQKILQREELTERVVSPVRKPVVETTALASGGPALISQDGAVYPLDRAYVIGRYPLGEASVHSAAASPIVVHNDNHVSRVHAYVSVDGGAVCVRDAGTSGGTFIAAPAAKDWTRIGMAPTELEPGWSLRIGGLILTYEAEPRP
jgi:hypothetical protein